MKVLSVCADADKAATKERSTEMNLGRLTPQASCSRKETFALLTVESLPRS